MYISIIGHVYQLLLLQYQLDSQSIKVRDVMPSKPCKFGAVIFLSSCYYNTGIYLYFRKSAKLVKSSSLSVPLKCFVTGLKWLKSDNSPLLSYNS